MFFGKSVLATITVLLGAPMERACAAGIEFVTAELPWAAVNKPYAPPPLEVRIGGGCPLGGVGFAVVSGAAPPGLALSRLGYFSGTASRKGTYDFVVRVTNGCSWTAKNFTIVVNDPPVLAVKPERLQFQAVAGEDSPREKILRVSASWPDVPYEIGISGGEWVKARPDRGHATSAGDGDAVHIRVDSTGLQAGYYSATITLSAWQAEPVPILIELAVLRK